MRNLILALAMMAFTQVNATKMPTKYWKWLPSTQLQNANQEGDYLHGPNLVVDGRGYTTAVWVEQARRDWPNLTLSTTIKSVRYENDQWTDPASLTVDNSCYGTSPSIVAGSDGVITAVLSCSTDPGRPTLYSTRLVNGQWEQPVLIDDDQGMYSPKLAIDGKGNIIAVWYSKEEMISVGKWRIKVLTARFQNGQWSPPLVLTESEQAFSYVEDPVLLSNQRGLISAGWIIERDGQPAAEIMSYDGDEWGGFKRLPRTFGSKNLKIVIDDLGNLMVIVESRDANSLCSINAIRISEGVVNSAIGINDIPHTDSVGPAVSGDGAGNVNVAWKEYSKGTESIKVRVYNGVYWRPEVEVFKQSFESLISLRSPKIITDQEGVVTLAWGGSASSCNPGGCSSWPSSVMSTRYVKGTWGPVIRHDVSGDVTDVVADAKGSVTVGAYSRGTDSYGFTTSMSINVLRGGYTETQVEQRSLNIEVAGFGKIVDETETIDCLSSCVMRYTRGALLDLTAKPVDGYTFAGWSGACSGNKTCRIILDDDVNVAAQFKDLSTQGLVTVDVKGPNAFFTVTSDPPGISCNPGGTGDCAAYFDKRRKIRLTSGLQIPSYIFNPPSYKFKGWRGACFGKKQECTLRVRNKAKVVAVHDIP